MSQRAGFQNGDVIADRYRVLSRIAAGGMGEVFKVEHIELGKPFALKVMLAGLAADPTFVSRFKIEAIAASRIGHPNIIDISDFGQTAQGHFFFAMEFLEGMTLSQLIARDGPQPPKRVAGLGLQVARALAAAHELKIVHRDLKPDNVMVVQRPGNPELVKVLDFGVARVQVANESLGKTAVGRVVGTPQYMSPEQAKGLVVDARADIYSLGLILHELLLGQATFSGQTPQSVMVKQVTEPPPPLPERVPEPLRVLISSMLAKHPSERPQQMSEVISALELIAQPPKSDAGASARVWALAAMTGALLIATVLVVFASPPPSAEPAPIAPPTRAIVSPKKSALTRGEAALAAGDYAAADEALEEALTIEPSNWNALHGAGLAARKTKKYERAKERLLRAVDLASGPRDAALAQFELACVETQLGQLDSAVSRLRKAISLVGVESFKDALEADEDLAPLRSRADFARLKRGLTDKPDLLVQPGESLLALSNLSVKMLNDSHQATLAADYERAAKCLERCVKAQPNAHPCYLRLAEVYALRFRRDKDPLSQQKSKEAYQHFLQVAPANDPSVPGVWELLRR